MSTIKVNIELNLDKSDIKSMNAVAELFQALSASGEVKTEVVKTPGPANTDMVKEVKPKAKAVKPVKEETAPEETSPEETATEETATEDNQITVEYLREKLQDKAKVSIDNKEKIKNKLTELGAPNVTKLDPAKYADMLNFLDTL